MSKPPQNILLRVPNWVGDAILATPVITTLHQEFPNSPISIVANTWVKEIFEVNSYINELFTFNNKGLREFIKITAFLKKNFFDLGIILPNGFEAALMFFLTRVKKRLGYNTDCRGFLLTHRVPFSSDIQKKHRIMSYLNLLKWVGVKSFTQELFFPLPPETVSQAEEFWQKFNLKDELTIGLNPGSVYGEARRWPLEYFIKLGEKLIKELRARIIIFGSYHELELGEKIESTLPVVNMIGKTSLPFLGALLQKCNVLVTNDSGIMHVAAAVNCQKIVALFGPGDPKVTAPYTKRCIILKKTLPCSPCSYRKCPRRHPCLKGITVEEVFQKVVSSNFSQLG